MQTSPGLSAEESFLGGAPKASLLAPMLWWPEDSSRLNTASFLRARRFTSKAHYSHQQVPVTLASAVKGLVFRMWHLYHDLHLWLPPTLKCMSIGWQTGVKGEMPYQVVPSCENELHCQPMQSCLLRKGHPLDFVHVATEEMRGFTKRCFPRAVWSWISSLLSHHFVLLLRPLQQLPKSFIHLILKDFVKKTNQAWWFPPWKML